MRVVYRGPWGGIEIALDPYQSLEATRDVAVDVPDAVAERLIQDNGYHQWERADTGASAAAESAGERE